MVPSLSPVSPLHSLSCQVSTQMELARVGIVLLVWSITFSHQVHGKCTMHDKEAIFRDCEKYFETEYPSVSPSYVTNCCKTVERVPNMDMVFVLKLCTKKEIGHICQKIRRLGRSLQTRMVVTSSGLLATAVLHFLSHQVRESICLC
jgi:hypothetical protein